jgi:hypothetical protein
MYLVQCKFSVKGFIGTYGRPMGQGGRGLADHSTFLRPHVCQDEMVKKNSCYCLFFPIQLSSATFRADFLKLQGFRK